MRYFKIASMVMILAACCSQVEAGKSRVQRKRGQRNGEAAGQSEIQMPPVCGAKVKQRTSSQQGCTSQTCDCCLGAGGGAGIDVDSLTIPAQSKRLYEGYQARIKFELPEDVSIDLYDQPMTTPGKKRSFVVPVYKQDKKYDYHFTVSVVRDGKKYFKKHKVKDFQAGMILAVKVAAPEEVPDGELPIKVEAKPLAPGGKPAAKDDKKTKKKQGIKSGAKAAPVQNGISSGGKPTLPPVDPQ